MIYPYSLAAQRVTMNIPGGILILSGLVFAAWLRSVGLLGAYMVFVSGITVGTIGEMLFDWWKEGLESAALRRAQYIFSLVGYCLLCAILFIITVAWWRIRLALFGR